MTDGRLAEALRHYDPPRGVRLWHGGPTVAGALRGVSHVQAIWKPRPERHSIWELALHIAYWNYAVRRRITDGPRGGFARAPADWPAVPDPPSHARWNADRRLVREEHAALAVALADFDVAHLDDLAGGSDHTTYADLITGIVLHDTYHVGQIQLMKRFAPQGHA